MSSTSEVAKLVEKVIPLAILNFVKGNNLSVGVQYGFRKIF